MPGASDAGTAQQLESIRAERDRLRFIADHTPVMLVHCDRDGRFTFVNRAYAARHRTTPEALVGQLAKDVVSPAMFAHVSPYIERVLAGEAVEFTLSEAVDGAQQFLRASFVPERNAAGDVVGWVAGISNMTAVSDEKTVSLARFRELADAMPQIVWSCDASGRVDYLNRRWYELTSKTPGDLDPSGVMFGEDAERVQAAFDHSVATGQPFQEEYRLSLPNQAEPRWYLGRALPVRDEAGRIVRWYATSTDIHDQKQAEALLADSRERLRAALDASVTGTFRWDLDTNALDWDDNLDRLFGLEPGATARSLPDFVRLVHPDDRQRVIDACGRCEATGAPFDEEFRVVWPDGTVRWLSDKGRVHAGPHGTRYMSGACVDVTDRRMKEEALRAADRQKDEFLGMLAHEIRNPLAPMMYSASILERRLHDPELRRPLEVIARQARRMSRIVDDLLDVSRVTQGKISLQRDHIGIADVIVQCAESSRPRMDARRQTFIVEPVDPSLTVNGDAVRLAQVIENLLINAAKYTPDGGTITIGAVAAPDGMVEISVRDTGVGISDDMIGRVFDLFAQADTSLDRAEGGLGIGLTLVDRLVQMHGGRVEVHSDGPGLGSTFTVRLPLVAAAAAPSSGFQLDTAPARRRVLIVDDNVDSAQMVGMLIEMSGHEVRLVHDGRVAAGEAARFLPDLVLLDIGLPGLDGYHVIQQLRAMPEVATATIVATTGYGREEDRARCFAAGFDEHLTKPVDPSQIYRILAMPARS